MIQRKVKEGKERKECTGLCDLKPVISPNFPRPSHQPPQRCLCSAQWKKGVMTSVPALIADKTNQGGDRVVGGKGKFALWSRMCACLTG